MLRFGVKQSFSSSGDGPSVLPGCLKCGCEPNVFICSTGDIMIRLELCEASLPILLTHNMSCSVMPHEQALFTVAVTEKVPSDMCTRWCGLMFMSGRRLDSTVRHHLSRPDHRHIFERLYQLTPCPSTASLTCSAVVLIGSAACPSSSIPLQGPHLMHRHKHSLPATPWVSPIYPGFTRCHPSLC